MKGLNVICGLGLLAITAIFAAAVVSGVKGLAILAYILIMGVSPVLGLFFLMTLGGWEVDG